MACTLKTDTRNERNNQNYDYLNMAEFEFTGRVVGLTVCAPGGCAGPE